ncbi:MAG: acyl-CoA dehydrogenase family protein [Chloroflexi bacterium]|nr:acyl-CoA dehydrogenase family protein [Chloroflexota bacterium]MCI0850335.1 acyl-CoA dehydrogenase family protein [Chloroflexota bacterium]
MDFELTEAQRLIQETARRIAKERVAPRAAEMDETGEYPHDVFEAFRDVGLLGLTLPESYGGSGAGTLALALAVEEVAKYCCSSGLILLLSALPTHPILLGGTERQKQAWLPRSARGEIKGAFCLTEPNAGSDASAIESRAVRDGDDYVLNGEKVFISGGTVADFVVVFAKTDSGNGVGSIAGFIVPTDSPGFSIARTDRKMGVRGVPTANIVFENVRLSPEQLLGEEEGAGFGHAMLTLNTLRPVVGARGVGLAEGAMTYALDYARQRQAFGKPIAELQAIQFMLADMAIQIEAARLLVYQGAWLVDQKKYQRQDAALLSIAKAFASEVAVKVSSDAMQVMGAQGYMMDHPLERHYRDARQLMIVEGTSQIQRVVIARALLERELVYP